MREIGAGRILAVLSGLVFAAHGALAASAAPSRPVAFVHAAVVPMDEPRLLRDQTVVVSGGRIVALGDSAATPVPKGAEVVDATGRYVMPGLADMHVHLYTPQELTLYVVNGVTTVFNLNGRPAHLSWRRRIADGRLLGPTIYSAGPTFDRRRTAEEAVAEVDRQSAAGYDAVKIYNQVSAAEYPALAAEAKKKDLVLVGHVPREPGFEATLAAGQSIAHAEEYVYTFFNDDPDPRNEVVHPLDTSKIPKAVAMSREAGISVIPTLVAFHNIVRQATAVKAYLEDPHFVYLAPSMRAALEPANNTYANRWPPERLPGLAISYEFQRQLVKALHEGGVPILAGTDAAWLGVPGFSLVEEVESFQDLGFTPYAALRTATLDPARLLGREKEFGTVAVGKRADLVLTKKNPLEDVRALEGITGVVANGRWIPGPERRSLLAGLPASYRASLARYARQAETDPAALDVELAANDPLGIVSSAVLVDLASSRSPEQFAELLRRLHRERSDSSLTAEETLNQLGYDLYAARKADAALAAFRLNTELYPSSGNAYDSLAETYLRLGKEDVALELYAKALEVQPEYPNAKAAREIIAAKKP
jgi:tetratricopeptide (TPR) repeat protein